MITSLTNLPRKIRLNEWSFFLNCSYVCGPSRREFVTLTYLVYCLTLFQKKTVRTFWLIALEGKKEYKNLRLLKFSKNSKMKMKNEKEKIKIFLHGHNFSKQSLIINKKQVTNDRLIMTMTNLLWGILLKYGVPQKNC